jgi:hypothetical protein
MIRTELSASAHQQQSCIQEDEFSAAFLIGIPGGHFNEQQNYWVLPVTCHKLLYTPRLLALMLLLALPHLPSKRPNRPATHDTVIGDSLANSSSSSDVHKTACAANSCLQYSCTQASDCVTSSSPVGTTTYTSGALGEGLENEWELKSPELPASPQPPEEQAETQIKSHGTATGTALQHAPSIERLCIADEAFPAECAVESSYLVHTSGVSSFAGIGTHHVFSSSHAPDTAHVDNAHVDQPVQELGLDVGSVWLALAQAERKLMLEVQRLRTLRQQQMPDPVVMLSCMLRIYAQDVLWSQHMRSVAAAAVAVSISNSPEHSTVCTCSEHSHNQVTASCMEHQQEPRRGYISITQAAGLLHAVGEVIASTSAARMHGMSSLQAPGNRGDHKREEQHPWVLKERSCNVASVNEIVAQRTAVQVVTPIATPERFSQKDSKSALIWHKVRFQSSSP